jgi:hypothetical protein
MVPEAVQVLTLVLMLGAMVFAGIAGGWPERSAALIIFAATVSTWVAQGQAGATPEGAFLLIDTIAAVALVVVLLRSKLFWAGVACCANMLMLAFTATRFFDFPLSEDGYVVMLQVSSLLVSLSLIYGTWNRRWGQQDVTPKFA